MTAKKDLTFVIHSSVLQLRIDLDQDCRREQLIKSGLGKVK